MQNLNRLSADPAAPDMQSKDVVLAAVELSKVFVEAGGNRITVLDRVNLNVHAGEKIAIVGASGAGKSTLLHLLGSLDKPSSGSVMINGEDVVLMSEKRRCRVRNENLGFIYQFHHLLPEFTAQENVAMPLLVRGVSPSQALEKARNLLEKVGMSRRLSHKPGELSGGERQRAAIARAMSTEPRCILADEPTGNLDRSNAEQAAQVMFRLNGEFETSLIVVTHDLRLAERMDVVYTIENGALVKQGTVVSPP